MLDLILTVEIHPVGAWYSDLRGSLRSKDWDTLRHEAYERYDHRCSVCGSRAHLLKAHDTWSFDPGTGIQKLLGVDAFCPGCHGVKHFKLTAHQGFANDAISHFMTVNRVDRSVFFEHLAEVERRAKSMGGTKWETDISLLTDRDIYPKC